MTLTATASAGFVFAGWSGAYSGSGTCTVTVNADTAVTADFIGQIGPGPSYCVVPKVKGKTLAAKRGSKVNLVVSKGRP